MLAWSLGSEEELHSLGWCSSTSRANCESPCACARKPPSQSSRSLPSFTRERRAAPAVVCWRPCGSQHRELPPKACHESEILAEHARPRLDAVLRTFT